MNIKKPDSKSIDLSEFDKPNLTNDEAAAFVGAASSTMRKSRVTGMLFGKPAPKFEKRGGKIIYKPKECKKFNAQFPEYENTAQAKVDQGAG